MSEMDITVEAELKTKYINVKEENGGCVTENDGVLEPSIERIASRQNEDVSEEWVNDCFGDIQLKYDNCKETDNRPKYVNANEAHTVYAKIEGQEVRIKSEININDDYNIIVDSSHTQKRPLEKSFVKDTRFVFLFIIVS